MLFPDAVKTCVKEKYATFSGRASRSEYWYYVLFYVILYTITMVIDSALFPAPIGAESAMHPISTILSLILMLPSLAVTARRLHDINRSGWFQLLVFIPIIGFIILIIWYCQKSDAGDNRFGPAPIV